MVAYAVTTTVVPPGNLTEVTTAIEAQIETVTDTKTVFLMNVYFNTVTGQYEGVLVHAT